MAFQFVHASTYSIKSGGAGIAAEAGRKPEHSRHVDQPLPPVLLDGSMEPEAAWAEIERRHAAASTTIKTKTGESKERKLRSDMNIMLAAVASYPSTTEETDLKDENFIKWQKATLEFFEKHHGPALSAVLHLDESHPHIHYITAPDLEAGKRMADIHPGEAAKEAKGGRKGKKLEKDRAFKDAMRSYQDDYHDSVSKFFGHARLGPRRQRKTRDEWKASQAEDLRVAQRLADLDAEKQALDNAREKSRQLIEGRSNILKTAETNLVEAEKTVREKERALQLLDEKLSKQQIAIDKLETKLSKRQEKIETFEARSSGVVGTVVAIFSVGLATYRKRVQRGVEEEKAKLARKIQSAKNTVERHKNKVLDAEQKLDQIKRDTSHQDLRIIELQVELTAAREALQATLSPPKPEPLGPERSLDRGAHKPSDRGGYGL